jgi:glucose/arabinose dehydrogenase
MWYCLPVALGLLLLAACKNSTSTSTVVSLPFEMRLQPVVTAGLSSPIDLQAPPGDSRLFIAERPGRIRVVQGGVLQTTPFLDISNRVTSNHGEAGLLSFAFHPQYLTDPQKQFVFVHFIEPTANINGDIVVERYQVSSNNPNLLDISTVQPVIRIQHRDFDNHYGGRVAFGPDGMLYLSTGDGGGGGDGLGNGQNVTTHLGKLLRLDVSNLNPNGVPPYTIPADNPAWGAAQPSENWAIGLRNPFRYAFDGAQLYIADVGQDQREEIDVVPANSGGRNYGWNIVEGLRCYPNGGQCNMTGLTLPVYDYDHNQGCAIIGGYVYRGAAIPELQGQYLFSDLCTGFVRSLSLMNAVATVSEAPNVNVGTPLSFGQDGFGEIYVLTADDRVLRIVR